MKKTKIYRGSERGGAGVKLLFVGLILFLVAHAGYNYIPVAYEAESMKQEMQTAVLQGTALPSHRNPVGVVKQRLQKAAVEYNLPTDAFIDVKQINNVVQARVYYKKQVNMFPLGIWSREYIFDQTAAPSGFLMKDN